MGNFREILGSLLKAPDKKGNLPREEVVRETADPVQKLELKDLLVQLGELSSILQPYLGNDAAAYRSPVGRRKEALELELQRRYEGGLLSADQEEKVEKLGYVSWKKKK